MSNRLRLRELTYAALGNSKGAGRVSGCFGINGITGARGAGTSVAGISVLEIGAASKGVVIHSIELVGVGIDVPRSAVFCRVGISVGGHAVTESTTLLTGTLSTGEFGVLRSGTDIRF